MDKNLEWVNEQRILRTIKALEKNNMNGYLVKNREELLHKIDEIVQEEALVSCGGSMTLFETGVIDHLRSDRFEFMDRYKEGLSDEDRKRMYKKTFVTDAYFTSSNAVTEEGELFNVDGTGNRVAAMIYGPEKVIVVCGVNKIVKDLAEAEERLKKVVAPANAKRLNRNTPCSKVGYCMNCNSDERICNDYAVIRNQANPDRIHVIFLNEYIGY